LSQIARRRAGAAALAALLAGVLLVDLPVLNPPAHGQKPMYPVTTRLEALNTPEPGGVVRVLATVTAWAPGEDVAFSLVLPPEVTVVAGTDAWTGTLSRGESRVFEVALSVPDGAPHEITARARIVDRPGATGASTLAIDLGGLDGPAALGRTVIGDGVVYTQYPGETRPRDRGER